MQALKDFVPQFAMPMLEDGKDPAGDPYWADYFAIHKSPPPYHNGQGLATHLGKHMRDFDESNQTDNARERLIRSYNATNRIQPFASHGKMPEVTRRFLNAVIRKAAKENPSRSQILLKWIEPK